MKGLRLLGVPLLLLVSAFEVFGSSPAESVDVAGVDEPAPSEPVQDTVVVSGRVTTDDARVAHVYSPVAGRVTKVQVRQGQRVKKGDALATIEAPDFDPSSDVYKAQADLIAAEHDAKRMKTLFELGEGRADFEAALDRLRAAKANMEIARVRARPLQLLRLADACPPYPCTYTLPSPVGGEVLAAEAVAGTFVQGQYDGAVAPELFVIGDLDRVWVLVDLDEGDLGRVRVGARAVVRADALPGEPFEGNVDWVSGSIDPVLHRAKARCTLDNPDRLLQPEMLGTVEIDALPR